jgi:hypothetical protein
MAEQEFVLDKERIEYEGIFSVAGLYRLIDEWLLDKGYYRKEPMHTESAKPEGKFVEIQLVPEREISDYAKSILRIRIQLSGIKDVVIEGTDGSKQRQNQGKVLVTLSGVLETDYEGKWEGKPMFLFIRTIYDKYLYKPLTGGFQAIVRTDADHLKNAIAGFLNLHRYTT